MENQTGFALFNNTTKRWVSPPNILEKMSKKGRAGKGDLVSEPPLTGAAEPGFRKLMSQEYRKALAGDDLSSQYDILSARLWNDRHTMSKAMRDSMSKEVEMLRKRLGYPDPAVEYLSKPGKLTKGM